MQPTPQYRSRTLGRALIAACLAAGVAAGCWDNDEPTTPRPAGVGMVEANISTLGSRVDSNGYVLIVDGALPQSRREFRVEPNSQIVFALEAGRHSVELADLSAQCRAVTDASRLAFITKDHRSALYFSVECVAPAALVISTETHGINADQDGYLVVIGGKIRGVLAPFDTVRIDSVAPGTNAVQLRGVAGNCVTAGGATAQVRLGEDETQNLHFRLTCGPRLDDVPGEILVVASRAHEQHDLDLFLLSTDGRTRERLTDHPGNDFAPSISPDGNQIAFVRDNRLMMLDRAARRETALPIETGERVAWSPDGARFVFAQDGGLYIATVDGVFLTELTPKGSGDRSPYWSPNGSRIAFSRGSGDESNIVLIDVNTLQITKLTSDGSMTAGPWSPDGASLLGATMSGHCDYYYYYSYSYSCNTLVDLALVNVATHETKLVTASPLEIETSAAWGPGGDKIYFVKEMAGQVDVYVLQLGGTTGPQNITRSYDYEMWVTVGLIRTTGSTVAASRVSR